VKTSRDHKIISKCDHHLWWQWFPGMFNV
jgi:hypothetical protein